MRKRVARPKPRTRPRFTREELEWLERELARAPVHRLKKITPERLAKKERGMFPSRPTSARGRKLDPRRLAAWNEWEMAPYGQKPSYRTLAVRFFGRADCPLCGGKQTISFRDNGYHCEGCDTQFMFARNPKKADQQNRLDPPRLAPPVGESDTVLKLSWPEGRQNIAALKKAIPRLHRQLEERTKSSS